MSRSALLKPVAVPSRKNTGRAAWCVSVPAHLSPTGKRQRRFFATKDEASGECERLKARKDNFGISLKSLTPARIAEASQAYALLDPHGIDLLVAVRSHLDTVKQRSQSVSFGEAFDLFASLKEGKSLKYRQEIRHARATFGPVLDKMVCDVSPSELETILQTLPSAARNAKMRRVRSVFNLAIKRGWMPSGTSPVARLDFADCARKEVLVFSAAEVERMLVDALENDLELLPFLTLAAFCGIRPDGELQKLLWSDLKFDGDKPQVVIRPEVSKINRRRFVDLSENALTWIEAYRQHGGVTEGKIVPFSANVLRKKRRKNRVGAHISRWIQQGFRHTFCSAWLAMNKDVNELVLQSGHTDPETMWKHYHRALSESEAKAFWSIRPPMEQKNIISLSGRNEKLLTAFNALC
jgi:integrase